LRSAPWTILAALLCASMAGALGWGRDERKQVARALEKEFRTQTLVLRNYYTGDRLVYDTSGRLVEGGTPGTWTLDGHVQIKRFELNADSLEVEGDRVYMGYDVKNRVWNGFVGRVVSIKILAPTGELTLARVQGQFFKVFLHLEEDKESLVPRYWLPIMAGRKLVDVPPEIGMLEDDVIELVGPSAGVSPPEGISMPEPPYTQYAREGGISGRVEFDVVVGKDGSIRDILETDRVLGGGLDQSAIATVRTWKFKPALKSGVPVPVLMYVEITFRRM
jgi:TonB family protein